MPSTLDCLDQQPTHEDAPPRRNVQHSQAAAEVTTAGRPGSTMLDAIEAALRVVVERDCRGKANAKPWRVIGALVEIEILDKTGERLPWDALTVIRRCQEAAARLRRSRVPVGGISGAGIFLAVSPEDCRAIAAERVARIRADAEELRVFDLAKAEAVLGQLTTEARAA